MNKKAQAFVWLSIMVSIFAMGLLYIMLDQPLEQIKTETASNFTGSRYESTYKKLNTIWDWWLLLFLLGIFIYGVLTILKRSGYDVY